MIKRINQSTRRPSRTGTFDVYAIDKDALLIGRLKGGLDVRMAEKIVEFVETKESIDEKGFNRFCDMSRLEGIHLASDDILQLAARRRTFNPNDIRVKSAFWATDPLAFGISRMYEQMLNSPRIEVRVWRDIQAAADWLGVQMDRLTL